MHSRRSALWWEWWWAAEQPSAAPSSRSTYRRRTHLILGVYILQAMRYLLIPKSMHATNILHILIVVRRRGRIWVRNAEVRRASGGDDPAHPPQQWRDIETLHNRQVDAGESNKQCFGIVSRMCGPSTAVAVQRGSGHVIYPNPNPYPNPWRTRTSKITSGLPHDRPNVQ